MSAQKLKISAVILMTIDHVGYILNLLSRYQVAGMDYTNYLTDDFWFMRLIGRLAFPLFAYLIAEGCTHTKDIKKYIVRLSIFALISQLPYLIFSNLRYGTSNLFRFAGSSVMVTLTLGAVSVYCYKNIFSGKKLLGILGILAMYILTFIFRCEYDICGITIILLVYAFRKKSDFDLDKHIPGSKLLQVILCTAVAALYYQFIIPSSIDEVVAVSLSGILLLLYNNKPGKRMWKWAFYLYYPVHLLCLSLIMLFIIK